MAIKEQKINFTQRRKDAKKKDEKRAVSRKQ